MTPDEYDKAKKRIAKFEQNQRDENRFNQLLLELSEIKKLSEKSNAEFIIIDVREKVIRFSNDREKMIGRTVCSLERHGDEQSKLVYAFLDWSTEQIQKLRDAATLEMENA